MIQKLKRPLSIFFICYMFVSSVLAYFNPVPLYADSNDRRVALLNMAGGKDSKSIDAIRNIDMASLQILATFLSNFYSPGVTVLDGDYKPEAEEDDTGNTEHVKHMKEALVNHLGVESHLAEYIIQYILAESLNTAQPLYVEESVLREAFAKMTYDKAPLSVGQPDLHYFLDRVTFYYDGATAQKDENGDDIKLTEFDHYLHFLGSSNRKTLDSVKYVKVTYPVFLALMSYHAKIAVDKNNKNYNQSKRKVGNTDKIYDYSTVNFYDLSRGTPSIVFDTSDTSFHAFLSSVEDTNVENGVLSSLFSVSDTTVEKIIGKKGNLGAVSYGQFVYVNWEGTLLLDTGVYRTPLVPGCLNPFMFSKIGSTQGSSLPTTNTFLMSKILTKVKDKPLVIKGSNDIYEIVYKTGDGVDKTILDMVNWKVVRGDSEEDLDQNPNPFISDWGKFENYAKYMESIRGMTLNTHKGVPDIVKFPDFSALKGGKYVDGYIYLNTEIKEKLNLLTDIVTYDSLGSVTAESKLSDLFVTATTTDGTLTKNLSGLTKLIFDNVENLGDSRPISGDIKSLSGSIFTTYCFAYFNKGAITYNKDNNIVDLKLYTDSFPKFNNNIDWTNFGKGAMDDEIKSFLYYLLHPVKGVLYFAKLLTNKLGGFFIYWHDKMVGGTDSNTATGMTSYLGTSSYTTTPALRDIGWIAVIFDNYNNIIIFLIVIMSAILLAYMITGTISVIRGTIGIIMFSFLAFLPPFTIDLTVNTINNFSGTIYSEKFSYWAVTQMESWLLGFDTALKDKDTGDFSSYASFVLANNAMMADDITQTYSGSKVKWMTPKRYTAVKVIEDKLSSITTDAEFAKGLLASTAVNTASGETRLTSDNALYLYRDFTDIYRYGSTLHNIWGTFNYLGTLRDQGTIGTYADGTDVVPYYSKSKKKDTYKTNWLGSVGATGAAKAKISSTLDFSKYLLANNNADLSKSNAMTATSSINHLYRGFLTNNTSHNLDSSKTKSYLYNVNDKTQKNTVALSLLALYNENVLRTQKNLNALKYITEDNNKPKLTLTLSDNILDEENYDRLGRNKKHGIPFNIGAKVHSNYKKIVNGLEGAVAQKEVYLQDNRLGYGDIIHAKDSAGTVSLLTIGRDLSSYVYGMYSESPYYFFNNNIRDQVHALTHYKYNYNSLSNPKTGGKMSNVAGMFLSDKNKESKDAKYGSYNNQGYFFNLSPNADSGYGEMRDFMNMHDFFYYIIPMLKPGTDLAKLYDAHFGLNYDKDISLRFNVTGTDTISSKFTYDGISYSSLSEFTGVWKGMTAEQRYKFWHTYNTFTILHNYTAWIDTLYDCDYAKPYTITVAGEKFKVQDPINPLSYFETDKKNNMIKGRPMVFSKSEMAYFGLELHDLTPVERKIIDLQEKVYEETIKLMDFYTLSDETLIHAYAMLQTFEFNKAFSQNKVLSKSYNLYPQGYELKAFSYDAYLRMIMHEASGESLMTSNEDTKENTSIYKRILAKTSILFAILLVINDIFAVYLLPGLKIFFIVCLFLVSIALITSSAVKLELNVIKVVWHSLFAPLIQFLLVGLGMSFIVSRFMSSSANKVSGNTFTINLGDPTATLIVMIVINAFVTILYFKLCAKAFKDLKTYYKALGTNIGGTIAGAVGVATGVALAKLKGNRGTKSAGSAKSRGKANTSKGSGDSKSRENMSDKEKERHDLADKRKDTSENMNKYDKKAFDKQNAKQDKYNTKLDKLNRDYDMLKQNGASQKTLDKLNAKRNKLSTKASNAGLKANKISTNGTWKTRSINALKYRKGELLGKGISGSKNAVNNAYNKIKHGYNASKNAVQQSNTKSKNTTKNAVKNQTTKQSKNGQVRRQRPSGHTTKRKLKRAQAKKSRRRNRGKK